MRASEVYGSDWQEIGAEWEELDEAQPVGGKKPLTPAQTVVRAKKQSAANDKVKDARATADIKINAAVKKAAGI